MSSKQKEKLSIDAWIRKYKARFNREPRNENDLIQFSNSAANQRTYRPLTYREVRKYYEKQKTGAQERSESRESRAAYKLDDEVVLTKDRSGTVRFVGRVDFAHGIWYGIELHPQFVGDTDGAKDERRYFKVGENRGQFFQEKHIRRKMTKKDHERQSSWLVAHGDRLSRRVSANGASSGTAPQSETATEMDEDGQGTEVQDFAIKFTETPGEYVEEPPAADNAPPPQEPEPEADVETSYAADEVVDADEAPPAQVDVVVEEKEPMIIQVDNLDFYPAKEGENVLQFCANQNDPNLRSDLLDLYTNITVSAHLRVVFEDLKSFEKQEQCTLLLEDLLPRLQKLV